jgi:hypothetical protein
MADHAPASFDLNTVALLREVLDEAWALVAIKERIGTTKSLLAERILKAAASGERDRQRLIDVALRSERAA